jgi:putative alpha-1,2-mannosidase
VSTSDSPETGYRSRFSHYSEKASPGYYKVLLEDYGIIAELTTTTHTGFHQYSFPENTDVAHIIMDMNYNIYYGKVRATAFKKVEN